MIQQNQYPLPLIDNTLFIDNSTQEKMMTCPRSAGYYVGLKRELNKTKSALQFGSIAHKVLEERYSRHASYLDASGVAAMVKAADVGFVDYQPAPEEFRNYGMMVSLISKYSETYPLEEFEPYRFPDGTPFVERTFALPLGVVPVNAEVWVLNPDDSISRRFILDLNIVQKGKIDLVYKREGKLYGMDHKTTSIMGPQFFAEFDLSSQVYCYTWAIQQLIHENLAGYTINGIGVRQPTKTGKSLEFVRHTIPVTTAGVEEWVNDTLHIVADYIEMCRREYLPKHTKWCVGKYGPCEYKPVCGLDPDYRLTSLFSNEYRDVTWDPLKE